jgi:hypothetical protein
VEDFGERGEDILSRRFNRGTVNRPAISACPIHQRNQTRGFFMLRICVCLTAVLLVAGSLHTASAQTPAPSSKLKLTVEKLKEMKAKWAVNRPKLKACRKEVKAKGLTGDDRWFYIEDCMGKT